MWGETEWAMFGIVFGWVLHEISTWERRYFTEKRFKKRVRSLISIEIVKNPENIRRYWHHVRARSDSEEFELGFSTADEGPLKRLRETPFPILGKSVWESQLQQVPVSFDPNEAREAMDIYEKLDRCKALFVGYSTDILGSVHTIDDVQRYYERLKLAIGDVIDCRNPIKN
jgi:hypothetical protein